MSTVWRPHPSCPVCGTNDTVEALVQPVADRQLFCTGCVTVFTGTEGEWHANRGRRERRAAAARNAARAADAAREAS